MIQIAAINETATGSKMRAVKRGCSEQLHDLWNHHFGVQEWWMCPTKFLNVYTSTYYLYGLLHFQIYPSKCSYQNPGSQPNIRLAENNNWDKGSGTEMQLKCKKSVHPKCIWQNGEGAEPFETQTPAWRQILEGEIHSWNKVSFLAIFKVDWRNIKEKS